ncbi:hypothetical protein NPX79_03375 [Spiroplasma endosymbiont of Anurida maritima]|uniref:hypothetical protein n=1 Tax=Spiroplasma endosymbiont of Anurida maritima TaxID=2967972 RepID=UPI0036D42AFD
MLNSNAYFNTGGNQGLLIFLWCGIAISAFLLGTVLFFHLGFIKKVKTKLITKSYTNKMALLYIYGAIFISLLVFALGLMFGYLNFQDNPLITIIIIVVIGFLIDIAVVVILYFNLQYISVGLSETHLHLFGEKILINKIIDFDVEKSEKHFFVHYIEGNSNKKSYKILKNSKTGIFLLDIMDELNFEEE